MTRNIRIFLNCIHAVIQILPFIDFPGLEGGGCYPASCRKTKEFDAFFRHMVPRRAGLLPAQHQLVSWIPHKPKQKSEFLPTSAVFSLRQVLNQNMSAPIHTGDHFTLSALTRHHNKNQCITKTYFFCGCFHPQRFLSSSPRGYYCNRDSIFPCHSPSLSSFPFHQSQNIAQQNTQER